MDITELYIIENVHGLACVGTLIVCGCVSVCGMHLSFM